MRLFPFYWLAMEENTKQQNYHNRYSQDFIDAITCAIRVKMVSADYVAETHKIPKSLINQWLVDNTGCKNVNNLGSCKIIG